MYKITYIHKGETVEHPLYLPGNDDYSLLSAELSLGVGKSGSLELEIPDSSKAKADIVCLADEVVFYRDDVELWRGRPITWQTDFDRTGTLTCEGALSYLYDTWYPPYDYKGTPEGLFKDVLTQHNSQVTEDRQLQPGMITVTDPNDYIARSNQDYSRSLNVLTDKLVGESLGGYLRVRVQDGIRYLDYLKSYGTTATQAIQLGVNLLDIAQSVEFGELATVLLPLGKRDEETGKRLTVSSVNHGSIYLVDEAAVATYGTIVASATWDDVTEPQNLLTKGRQYLAQITTAVTSVTVNAVDLAMVSQTEVAINLGDSVLIQSEPHGINQYFELTSLTIHPLNPAEDTLTFGGDTAGLTERQSQNDRATQGDLAQLAVRLDRVTATYVTTDYLSANYATITNLEAITAHIGDLSADLANVGQLVADKADITDLEAATAHIDDLSADVANIETLLAGNVGTGNLQAIHITGDNVVIDDAVITDAMIANLSASKLTAGIIYTSLIQIASDQDEHLLIDGATLQIKDSRGTVRVQIGQDGSGDYNYYLWDADGRLMWSPTGVTAAGLNDGIIRDINVAEDAAISGDKLDIASVAQRLNEDGSITVEAGQVTIDGTKLDVAYQTITQKVTDVQSDAVAQITTYYALGTSSTEPPSDPAGGSVGGGAIVGTATVGTAIVGQSSSDSEVKTKAATVATVGSAIVGQALVGSLVLSSDWTTERLTAQDGEYLWTAGLVEYLDGTTTWTTPTCLTDGLVREETTTLQTALNVVQGQISSKVWQTDIISAVDPLGQEINILQDQYTTLTQTMDGLQVEVVDLTTTVSGNYRELDSKLTEISVTTEGLSTQVSSVQAAIDGVQTTTETLSSRIEQLADSISLSVTGSLGGTASIVLSVDGEETSKSLDLSKVRAAFANDESAVTISAGTVAFGANTLIVNSSNFTLDQSGNVSVAGTITAQSGSIIGDWGITSGKIFATSPVYQNTDGKYPVAAMQVPGGMDGTANWVFAAGGTSHDNYTDCPFRVSKDGAAYVQKLNIPYDTDASGGYATIRAQNYGDGAGLKIDCSFILDVGNYIRCNMPYGDFILQEAILGVTSDSNLSIGAGIPAHSMDDNSGNTHIHGRWIKLICGTEGEGQVQLIKERTGDLRTVFRPASNGGAYLGTSSYRWASVYCSDGAFNGSDRKLKDHIAYLDEVDHMEDFVMALRPVEYTLKAGTGKRTHMGLYAQDVAQAARSTIGDLAAYQAARRGPGEEELPYTQDIPDDELDWSLNYSELIAPLIAVIQKQSHKLVELEERINMIGGIKS